MKKVVPSQAPSIAAPSNCCTGAKGKEWSPLDGPSEAFNSSVTPQGGSKGPSGAGVEKGIKNK